MDNADEGSVESHREGDVLICTLSRAARRNRVTPRMCLALADRLDDVRRDDGIAGCVITGAGDVFCEGGDFRAAGTSVQNQLRAGELNIAVFRAIREAGKPVVAAVNGNAHAGGFALVAACDLAFSVPGATYGLPEAAHGLFPLIATAVIKDQLPPKLFFDLVYRQTFLTAADCVTLGLVNAVVAPDQVLAAAVDAVGSTRGINRQVMAIGRGLYFELRASNTPEALEHARLALAVGITAMAEGERRAQPTTAKETP